MIEDSSFLDDPQNALIVEKQIVKELVAYAGKEIFHPSIEHLAEQFAQFKKDSCSSPHVITVAGTNGKGQCVLTLSHLATRAKLRTISFLSPHIFTIRERILINNKMITYRELYQNWQEVRNCLEQANLRVSFYELLFLIFLQAIKRRDIDLLIIEVGLGGRLDAVNLFDADIAVITSISRDHQEILGNSYRSILYEKLAITRKYLRTSFSLKYLQQWTAKHCASRHIDWQNIYPNNWQQADYFTRNEEFSCYIFTQYLRLYQAKLLGSLDPSEMVAKFRTDLPQHFTGRMEEEHHIIFIGAHNTDGMRNAFIKLQQIEGDYFLLVAFSQRDVSDIYTMLSTLALLKKKIYLTTFDHFKAYRTRLLHYSYVEWPSFIKRAIQQKERVVVTGSYYFIGEVKKFLRSENL